MDLRLTLCDIFRRSWCQISFSRHTNMTFISIKRLNLVIEKKKCHKRVQRILGSMLDSHHLLHMSNMSDRYVTSWLGYSEVCLMKWRRGPGLKLGKEEGWGGFTHGLKRQAPLRTITRMNNASLCHEQLPDIVIKFIILVKILVAVVATVRRCVWFICISPKRSTLRSVLIVLCWFRF